MVRLSSKDASLLMDVLEQSSLPDKERLGLLDGADDQKVLEIGKALIHPEQTIDDPDVKEAVDQILHWAETTKQIEDQQLIA